MQVIQPELMLEQSDITYTVHTPMCERDLKIHTKLLGGPEYSQLRTAYSINVSFMAPQLIRGFGANVAFAPVS